MTSVIVERAPADKQGPDIVNPLLCDPVAAVEAGRNAIDSACSNRQLFKISGPLRRRIAPGALVRCLTRRGTAGGMVRRSIITISKDEKTFQAQISLEIETEDV